MRNRKAKGKQKARVTLTELDLIEAGYAYLEQRGYKLGNLCFLKMPKPERVNGRRRKVELVVEVDKFP